MGPWLLTFDESLIAIAEIGRQEMEWGDGLATHVKQFLEYLVAFQPAELEDREDSELVEGLIRYTVRKEDEGLELEEYVDLIAPRFEMEEAPRDVVMEIFLKHPMKETLQEALHDNRGGEAAKITQNILGSEYHLNKVIEQKETKEKLKKAQETANEYREKYEREKKARQALQNQSITIRAEATAAAEAETVDLGTEANELIDLIDARIDGRFEEHGIPEPPTEETPPEQLRDCLQTLT